MNNRRTFLTGGSAIITAGIAGCTGVFDSDEGRGGEDDTGERGDGDSTEDDTDEKATDVAFDEFTNWIPRLGSADTVAVVVSRESDSFDVGEFELSPMTQRARFLSDGPNDGAVRYFFDVRSTLTDEEMGPFPLANISVLMGEFDHSEAREWLSFEYDTELQSVDEYGDLTIYAAESEDDSDVTASPFVTRHPLVSLADPDNSGLGVSDGAIVFANDRAMLEDGVDAANGEKSRLVDSHDGFAALTDELSDLDYVELEVELTDDSSYFDGSVEGISEGFKRTNDSYDGMWTVSHETEADVTEEMIAEIHQEIKEDDSVSDVTVEGDGRYIHVSTSIDQTALVDMFWPRYRPNSRFDFDVDIDNQRVEITHDGGDTLRAGRVRVRLEDSEWWIQRYWNEFESEMGPDSTVEAGDSIVIDQDVQQGDVLSPAYEIQIQWEREEGSYSYIEWVVGPER